MELTNNDRWHASFYPQRLGRYEYAVQAWRDAWATYCDELQKKFAAGLDVSVEVEEGRSLIASALMQAKGRAPEAEQILSTTLQKIGAPQTAKPVEKRPRVRNDDKPLPSAAPEQIAVLLSIAVARAMHTVDSRRFLSRSATTYPLTVERQAARFASWYELFPRSQSPQPGKHGTFQDIALRLSSIRDMGFDVLYFPPIHPIGRSNRKGKNNAVTAAQDEPGSPYAIGSSEGGHDAIHPELGTLDDFRQLLAQAREHELEIALDFAIQCSPDHPWLAQHPAWFAWRADGSLHYAENPPKRYEDIVNVVFYGPPGKRQTLLWTALRDIVLFWASNGVRLFRVDNPHTKPLPFWEWMIADVQSRYPDTLFLSEAFTRPKMMYRLAKIGFSQSYTYFTWRNTKQELTEYLTELNAPPACDIFRPHFFVNTPDINPYFLQTSGRPGFLIRAALATTLSGLWGMYNGFELCEARPLPGKEEYLDSEKYEIRAWNWNSPGNIIAEISQFNRIRRSNPALQTHLGLQFHHADNDQVIFFSKATAQRDNVVLIAISLDPHAAQTATLELPLREFGLPDDGVLDAEDLFNGYRFTWHGKYQPVHLTQQRPFALWRVSAPEGTERRNAL
jgi:starch synthase (maltosyl-transferring)